MESMNQRMNDRQQLCALVCAKVMREEEEFSAQHRVKFSMPSKPQINPARKPVRDPSTHPHPDIKEPYGNPAVPTPQEVPHSEPEKTPFVPPVSMIFEKFKSLKTTLHLF